MKGALNLIRTRAAHYSPTIHPLFTHYSPTIHKDILAVVFFFA